MLRGYPEAPGKNNIKNLPPRGNYYTIPSMATDKIADAREKLQLRLSRVIGQLQGLQKRLAGEESDCLSDIQQIKAAKNALWKVAEAYLEIHLAECVRQNKTPVEIQDNLQSVIRATFTM